MFVYFGRCEEDLRLNGCENVSTPFQYLYLIPSLSRSGVWLTMLWVRARDVEVIIETLFSAARNNNKGGL